MKRNFMERYLGGKKTAGTPTSEDKPKNGHKQALGASAENPGIRPSETGKAPTVRENEARGPDGEKAQEEKQPAPITRSQKDDTSQGNPSRQSGNDGDIFDDTDVCRALGVRRRVLVRSRTERSRGDAWDAKETHAGMTRRWIEARSRGASEGLRPIEAGDGVVTVRFVRRIANAKAAGVRVVASGAERVAWVHDANAMNLGEEFDCRWIGKQLHYVDALNREAY